ncbi:hypothetical protein [Pseudomonas bubulae]|uniref:hypothetical protein n=1 Tax=Pseudomonas bubulae TaxID=2316085 RepID=UPI001F44A7CB|nr:hypothetical protein [Pseudomonas bubulae]MCF3193332.1 hypothetical protein [Pseudomonas bubulae]
MTFQERMNYARERNKQHPNKITTTTAKPSKPQITLEQYRTYIITNALIKLEQRKENI